ncbi:2TM domain-containing protein [Rasiella sp. SM2506]|uniref:2TM domain-containing protein n=1 Tax=Rasiella sp. SM2506 TaxID=3423914 RepID=UPI003D7A53A7
MDYNTDKQNKYLRAKERVTEIKKFYTSLVGYVFVISMLATVNYYVNEWSNMWFLWAAFGWGIGLLFQAAKAYQWSPFMGKNWEERKLKEFMEEEDKQQWN